MTAQPDYETLQDTEPRYYLKRVGQLTRPADGPGITDSRREPRQLRAIPLLLCPWHDGAPVTVECRLVIAKDVSEHGLGVLVSDPPCGRLFVVGLQPDIRDPSQPWFFLGERRHLTEDASGCWTMGVQLMQFINPIFDDEVRQLRPMMKCLKPLLGGRITAMGTVDRT